MQVAVKLKIQNLNPQNAGEAARKGAAFVVEKKCFTVGAESLHRHMKYKPKGLCFPVSTWGALDCMHRVPRCCRSELELSCRTVCLWQL